MPRPPFCPDCDEPASPGVDRRQFVRRAGAAVAAASVGGIGFADDDQTASGQTTSGQTETPETLIQKLYESLSETQRGEICFAWDHQDDSRGLLRTHVSNNWSIVDRSRLNVAGDFFTRDQQELIEAIFFGMYDPEWHDRIRKQLKDDAGGYGKAQTIAIFGAPGQEHYQFVMTGRHLTIRCDGDSVDKVAFGGPIFYGHAAQGFYEEPGHPGNVFWPQAVQANSLYQMLDGRQREQALANPMPEESAVGFRGPQGPFPGLPLSELAADQKQAARDVLAGLLAPYRESSRREALELLEGQGGLDACSLSFFSKDGNGESVDVGDDGVWDVWRIEGPSFVWHFRGEPHVHVWVNVANDPTLPLNARG